MNTLFRILCLAAVVMLGGGCAALRNRERQSDSPFLGHVTGDRQLNEDRRAIQQPPAEDAPTLTLRRSVLVSESADPRYVILLPDGVYRKRAEDSEFIYYGAPRPLEFRILEHGNTLELRTFNGGIAAARSLMSKRPGAIYIIAGLNKMRLTWELDSAFFEKIREDAKIPSTP